MTAPLGVLEGTEEIWGGSLDAWVPCRVGKGRGAWQGGTHNTQMLTLGLRHHGGCRGRGGWPPCAWRW